MSKFILTFKLECTTQEGSDTYLERYRKLFNYLETECTAVIQDETTSTIICEADMPLYNDKKKSGLAYKILQEKFLLNKDEILFFKFLDKKFYIAGRIENLSYHQDQEIIDFFN